MTACRTTLKLIFLAVSAAMIALTVHTCLQQNLFAEWNRLGAEPWMRATLVDFYFNILILSTWTLWREKNKAVGVLWVVAYVILGSIATAFYVFLQLSRLKPGDGVEKALLRRE